MFANLEYPTFETTLPVSKKKVHFRPFNVKEMKTLMIQAEDKKEGGKIVDTINVCALNIKNEEMCQADREFLFLQIRAKSIGESINLAHKCECGQRNVFKLNFETDLKVAGKLKEKIVTLGNGVTVEMKHPDPGLVAEMKTNRTQESVEKVVVDGISSLTYMGETRVASDLPYEELLEFVQVDLTQKDFNKLENWILNQPKLYSESKYACTECGKENTIHTSGLLSFF